MSDGSENEEILRVAVDLALLAIFPDIFSAPECMVFYTCLASSKVSFLLPHIDMVTSFTT